MPTRTQPTSGRPVQQAATAARVKVRAETGRDAMLELQSSVGNREVTRQVEQRRSGAMPVQRHTSAEHNALGSIPPNKLAGIAGARDLLRRLGTGKGQDEIRNAIHTLELERKRVRDFEKAPPTRVTDAYSLRLVKIDNEEAAGKTPVIATYGEMNMLADFFGSVDELRKASNETIFKLLQTEREAYYLWLGNFLRELTAWDYEERIITVMGPDGPEPQAVKFYRPEGAGPDAPYSVPASARLTSQKFKGSQRGLQLNDLAHPIAAIISNQAGYHGGDMALAADPGVQKAKTGGAWGAVARNACHFAPQSWYAWKDGHEKARELAKASAQKRAAAAAAPAGQKETLIAEAEALANEAMLVNGFADHYLQDSFAAGHLINKTLVMQWFLTKIKTWDFFGPGGAELARLSQMGEDQQPGLATPELYSKDTSLRAMGPQAEASAGSASEGFDRAGLKAPIISPDAQRLLRWWRTEAAKDSDNETTTVEKAAKALGLANGRVQTAMDDLVRKGMAVAAIKLPFRDRRYDLNQSPHLQKGKAKAGTETDPARSMTMAAYHEFTNDALLQSGAGALHDLFCASGLDVANDEGTDLFKVYGDKALLDAEAAKGVEIAASTAQMSQAVIAGLLEGRREGDVTSIEAIFKRFPSKVRTPGEFAKEGAPVATFELDEFHKQLRPWLEARLEDGHWLAARAPEAVGGKKLTGMDQISPHSGEEF